MTDHQKTDVAAHLKTEMAAYDAMKDTLFKHHAGKFVVFRGEELLGAYDNFDNAARAAIKAFGRKTFLIREVKEKTVKRLPSSALFGQAYALS